MTVNTTQTNQVFAGGQAVLTFNFRTLVSNPNYISVLASPLSGGSTVILTYGSNYTVAVNATGVGGTVTVNPSYSTAYQYVVYRTTGLVQGSAYANFNQFPASTLENGLDQLTMLIQEITSNQGLTLQVPLGLSPTVSTTLPTPVGSNILGWNSAGTNIINYVPNVSTYLSKAAQADSEAATNDTLYMTPLQVKYEVQKAGAVLIPAVNVSTASTTWLGSWAAKSVSTVYLAATDGFVTAFGQTTSTSPGSITILSDGANPPTTLRFSMTQNGGTNYDLSATSPVRKNDYYKITISGNTSFSSGYFLPLGS